MSEIPHTRVTVRTPRSSETHTYIHSANWREVVVRAHALLTIEVLPYWPREQVRLDWLSRDPRTDGALYGLALALGLVEVPTDER